MDHKEYQYIAIESYKPLTAGGNRRSLKARPLPGQSPYETTMNVQCHGEMKSFRDYPEGTKFKVYAKIVRPKVRAPYVSTHYTWAFTVIKV